MVGETTDLDDKVERIRVMVVVATQTASREHSGGTNLWGLNLDHS